VPKKRKKVVAGFVGPCLLPWGDGFLGRESKPSFALSETVCRDTLAGDSRREDELTGLIVILGQVHFDAGFTEFPATGIAFRPNLRQEILASQAMED
jgi:hypothetical protein